MSDIRPTHRKRLFWGFAFCAGSLALVLVLLLILSAWTLATARPIDAADEPPASPTRERKLAMFVADLVVQSLFIVGLVCLYLVPQNLRWRRALTLLLAMCGVDLAILGVQFSSSEPHVVADRIAVGLGWIELWMLAVAAAMAAESIERSDLTYQTEVAGRLVLWGGFAWLAGQAWSLDLTGAAQDAEGTQTSEFALLLDFVAIVLRVFAMLRVTYCCVQLAREYRGTSDRPLSGATA